MLIHQYLFLSPFCRYHCCVDGNIYAIVTEPDPTECTSERILGPNPQAAKAKTMIDNVSYSLCTNTYYASSGDDVVIYIYIYVVL
jgi:hypothetical protein